MNSAPAIRLLLSRYADTAWREVLQPWLKGAPERLQRSYVVVPTRGQAHGLKTRCLTENLALLGVEFLSPGLARKKWIPLVAPDKSVLGRELLLLGLRAAIEKRLQPLTADDSAWGWWKSLQSDPERALDDFDDLLKAGFRAEHFPFAPLRDIFGELTEWAEQLGYEFAPRQAEAAALTPVAVDAPRLGGRLLIYGLSAEIWGEFFNVAALARRFDDITVVLPEPEFRGSKALDERWIEVWEALLGVNPLSIFAEEPPESCERVAALWNVGRDPLPANGSDAGQFELSFTPARVLVGKTRSDEVEYVADEIQQLLAQGAEAIAVIFPQADAVHLHLTRLLTERHVAFTDLLEAAGPPPAELQIQRGLLTFYERGGRLEELLELWPWLRTLGMVEISPGGVRRVCESLFDELQTHALDAYRARLAASEQAAAKEVSRVAELLLPPWPEELTLGEALGRFAVVCERFGLVAPAGWAALTAFAERETRSLPAKVIFATLNSFLPEASPPPVVAGKNVFSRVTLTTRRRAEGLAWSHVIFVEANAGLWPTRRAPSCWLTDEQRTELNATSRFSLGLFTSEDRSTLEKMSLGALARDTRKEVIFSAALYDESEPELKLAPNSWVERVLWDNGELAAPQRGFEEVFEGRAQFRAVRPQTADESIRSWQAVWAGRRDPAKPFDEFFLSLTSKQLRPARLAVRLLERAVQDPAELWFEAVLKTARVEWKPFARTRKKALGQLAHRVLASSLRSTPVEGVFGRKPEVATASARLGEELRLLREKWPQDRYWDSLHAELSRICRVLLAHVFLIEKGDYVATEVWLPEGATVELGASGYRLPVYGRLDLALLDRPEWKGAQAELVDFKTGLDAKLSAERMARDGSSLQLGVYLAAVQSLGAVDGRIWMLKPDEAETAMLPMEQLPHALMRLEQIEWHLRTGHYGALTPNRSEYGLSGFIWPLASVPIGETILQEKFAVTFGLVNEAESVNE